jgi:hypothetical protein
LAWRIFWMTMHNRCKPDVSPGLALAEIELTVLDHLVNDTAPSDRKTLSYYLTKIARLGGYLACASDPPPCDAVMWRGMSRLTDIRIGAAIAAKLVGN